VNIVDERGEGVGNRGMEANLTPEMQAVLDSRPQMVAMINAVSDGVSIVDACDKCGISRMTFHAWRREHPWYNEMFVRAWEDGADDLEKIMESCAKKALDDPRYQPSLHRTLQARRRSYQERYGVEMDVRGKIENEMSDSQLTDLCSQIASAMKKDDGSDSAENPA